MPVLPLVGSTMTVSFVILPSLFGRLDHCHADPVFNAAERVEEFALQKDGRIEALGDPVEFDEGSAAHGFDDVVIDFAHG